MLFGNITFNSVERYTEGEERKVCSVGCLSAMALNNAKKVTTFAENI